ncbi:hypothetical protein BDZ89DRAFT_1130606 [Hymenopellis radicata]|nr:hypothetical protein BDZ89DRAFT_1130606 [Hymenopellis radicata]
MATTTDDLPWPELGNVSRGATRGNQGQKGVLGPPDRDGRCILQLRVQPGVLAVRLNRQASDWYRTLDNEVNRALKMTKTYWRKARRRQDYDARADQDHMELHEWLQQLKDKTMSHLELLMQKGDIQGPPYVMPDDVELTFMRKFIERQAAGIPIIPGCATRWESLDMSDQGYGEHKMRAAGVDVSDASSNFLQSSRNSHSPSLRDPATLGQEATTSKQALQVSRSALARAQKDTQDAFLRYTACLDNERQARQSVLSAEKRRDDIMSAILALNQGVLTGVDQRSRHSSLPLDDNQRYHAEAVSRANTKTLDWSDAGDGQPVYATETLPQLEDPTGRSRKHSRTWESTTPLQQVDGQYDVHDITGLPPPRKRMHHMISGFEVLNNAAMQVPPQNTYHP